METETKTDNELIAEFMGLKTLTKDEFNSHPNHESLNVNEYSILEYQRYHTSWDWTIPVCRKLIADLLILIDEIQKQDVIDGDALHEAKRLKANLFYMIACLDLHRVNQALIEAIKWYNNQKENGKMAAGILQYALFVGVKKQGEFTLLAILLME